MNTKPDPFEEYLLKCNLLDLHQRAYQSGYRIRAVGANGIDIEYQGGLRFFTNCPQLRLVTVWGRKGVEDFLSLVEYLLATVPGIKER